MYRLCDARGGGISRQPVYRGVDRVERRIRLEKEIAGQSKIRDRFVNNVEIDNDQFATGNLELSMHEFKRTLA